MAYVFTVLFILLYTAFLVYWHKKVTWSFGEETSRRIKEVHFLTLAICLCSAVMYYRFGLELRGVWTTKIVILLTLFTGPFVILVTDKTIFTRLEKIYFSLFSMFPVITAALLCIPFLGIVVVGSLLLRLVAPPEIHYEDDQLRIQNSFRGVLAPAGFDVYAKKGIFEQQVYTNGYNSNHFDSLQVHYDKDSTRVILIKEKTETIRIALPKQQ